MEDRFPQYLIDFFAGFFKSKDKYPYVCYPRSSIGVGARLSLALPLEEGLAAPHHGSASTLHPSERHI